MKEEEEEEANKENRNKKKQPPSPLGIPFIELVFKYGAQRDQYDSFIVRNHLLCHYLDNYDLGVLNIDMVMMLFFIDHSYETFVAIHFHSYKVVTCKFLSNFHAILDNATGDAQQIEFRLGNRDQLCL